MPNQAFTFVPDLVVNERGEEEITSSGTLHTQSGGGTFEPDFAIDEETGDRIYDLSDADYAHDGDAVPDIDDEYIQNIYDAYPDFGNAQMYASRNWSQHQLEAFNEVMTNGELDKVMPLLEDLVNEYRQSGEEHEAQTFNEDDVELPSEDDVFSAYDEALEVNEPAGNETAYEWMNAAVEYQDSHPVYSGVCELTAAFHRGEMTQEEAWSTALERYDLAELTRIYKHFNQQ